MRIRDEIKQEALFEATVKLVNDIGFAASSVAKIAGEANISPATLYVYYKNKEDLLVSTYIAIKRQLSRAILKNFDTTQPIRDIMKLFWFNAFEYITNHPGHFQYSEQFANSPFSTLVDKSEVEKFFQPVFDILKRGIDQKIIKNIDFEILTVFVFYPVMILSNPRLCINFKINDQNIETAFTLAWDAIKL